ncbi:MAG: saccharopine dehydrogenase NADP-binding domain-containing protein [Clostridiales Family XIII bacterium]|jgi:saccharopine dehydrogenase-like NADP-dependent oxidoreductase|nr:saccharopine dehydrogenase NADP-binding domain-containing protein [Clostridiales Family XIII bacterium]
MKIMILGAGGQGAPCASILAKDPAVSEIKLCDINGGLLEKVKARIGSPKLRIETADASDEDGIAAAAAGFDAIVDLVTPAYFEGNMRAALKAGVHYLNTAWEEYIYEGFSEHGLRPDARLKYDDAFREKGRTAVLGCGMSSGYATNVVARYYVDRLDTVESIKFRLAKRDTRIPEEEEILHPWNPGWNPKQALLDFVVPTYKFENGEFVKMDQVFAEPEIWDFPAPVGRRQVSHHAHEEPFNIPQSFADKGLKYCDFKYYINKAVAPIVVLGLGSDKARDIGGQSVKPLDVVLSFIPDPGDAFLNEDPSRFEELDATSAVSIMTEIIGCRNGKKLRYLIHVPTMNVPRKHMYDTYGTSLISVALPAAVGVKMAAEGAKKGVIHPQDLDPQRFVQLMRESGYRNEWEETVEELGDA